jgi:hypothetical protein
VSDRFAGRVAVIATMHGKEAAIAPALQLRLQLDCEAAPPSFDSDRFGTFDGEVPRTGTMRDAGLAKARAALELAPHADFAVASEGSFSPHPATPLLTLATELVLLVGRDGELVAEGSHQTTDTNFARKPCRDAAEALAFAQGLGGPGHGLLLLAGDPPVAVARGLHGAAAIEGAFAALRTAHPDLELRAQSDMRADHNPTRMRAIGHAADDLAQRLATPCPGCGAPGFGPVDVLRGLPCELCGLPTDLVRAVVLGCRHCDTRRERPRDDGLQEADPAQCGLCNP